MTLADPPSQALRPPVVGVAPPPVVAPGEVVAPPEVRPARSPRLIPRGRRIEVALLVGVGVMTTVAVMIRFVGPHALWLDEALTVNIARLPLPKLFAALRHDGSPPAYYLLLHWWMGLFGTGTRSVRALAGVLSVATLPAAWRLGRAVGGRRVATALVVVVACNPFALRYGTENRMYSLIMLLATLAGLALLRCLQRPTVVRLFGFGVVCGLLLLTHYWALYLVAGLGGCLLVASVKGPVRPQARLALAALCGGGLLFLPWAPSFAFQAQHTGTPWATAPSAMTFASSLGEFAGWKTSSGLALFVVYCVMFAVVALAVGTRAVPAARRLATAVGWRRAVPGARLVGPIAGVALLTMVLAMAGGMVASAAFAYRYASVAQPFVLVLVALGVAAVGRTRLGAVGAAAVLVVIATMGTVAGASEVLDQRTEAVLVAAQITANARPGDVVAYCPDQLGPAVSRLLPSRMLTQITFPRFDDPSRINWVDYSTFNATGNPGVFAREILNLAGSRQIWLVWEAGYRTFGRNCQEIRDALEVARPNYTQPVNSQPALYYEHESLVRFAPE